MSKQVNKEEYQPIQVEKSKGIEPIDCWSMMIEQITYDPLLDEAIKSCTRPLEKPVTFLSTHNHQ